MRIFASFLLKYKTRKLPLALLFSQAPMTPSKKSLISHRRDVKPKKVQSQKFPIFLIKTIDFPHFGGFEQLSSSIDWRVMANMCQPKFWFCWT